MARTFLWVTILFNFQHAWTQNADPTIARRYHDSLYWINVKIDSGVVHAAVAFPKGSGPFPAVIILHGTHGFAQEYINLARRLADNGIVGIAACWFGGRKGLGQRFITPINFPDSPPLVDVAGSGRFRIARRSIDSLLIEVGKLPEVKDYQIALFGHSRGGGAALDYVVTHPGKVQAVVLNSTGYPPEVLQRSVDLSAPILIIHGDADDPADGGSAFTNIAMARQFEAELRAESKDVEVKFYKGSGHNSLFSDPAQFKDTVQQILHFVQKRFAK